MIPGPYLASLAYLLFGASLLRASLPGEPPEKGGDCDCLPTGDPNLLPPGGELENFELSRGEGPREERRGSRAEEEGEFEEFEAAVEFERDAGCLRGLLRGLCLEPPELGLVLASGPAPRESRSSSAEAAIPG